MKPFLPALAFLSLTLGHSHAGNVLVSNFEETLPRQLPISTSVSIPILTGGVVQIGTFASGDPSALIPGLFNPALLAALLSDFIAFGTTNAIGSDFIGLYASYKSAPIAADSPLVGKSIYTMIGNDTTLPRSTEFAIVRHPAQFAADNLSVFEAVADISDPAAVVVLGGTGAGYMTALGMSTSSLALGIPEPSSAIFLLVSLLGLGLRRRPPQLVTTSANTTIF